MSGVLAMFPRFYQTGLQSSDDWHKVSIKSKEKLFRVSQFLFMSGGRNYNIEIQEGLHGGFSAHAENTADPHDAIAPSQGATLQACLEQIVAEIGKRSIG